MNVMIMHTGGILDGPLLHDLPRRRHAKLSDIMQTLQHKVDQFIDGPCWHVFPPAATTCVLQHRETKHNQPPWPELPACEHRRASLAAAHCWSRHVHTMVAGRRKGPDGFALAVSASVSCSSKVND